MESYHIHSIHSTKFEWLIFGIEDNVDHGAYFSRNYVIGRVQQNALFEVVLERGIGPLNTGVNHITGHHF